MQFHKSLAITVVESIIISIVPKPLDSFFKLTWWISNKISHSSCVDFDDDVNWFIKMSRSLVP